MSENCRQHYDLATGKGPKPDVKGPPTQDPDGKGGAAGDIHKGDGGECAADEYAPTCPPTANPNSRW